MVYASADSKAAFVLTPNDAGVKEDIVLSQSLGDEALFQWDLALPPGLEARVEPNGDVGIYGPSSILADDIQIGDDKSRALIESARQNASKNDLVYRIPAPVVRETSGREHRNIAAFDLNGTRLSLRAHGLAALQYPINIDPTVVVTLTADFSLSGSLETDIDATGDQLKRTKGVADIGTFAATTSFATARQPPTGVTPQQPSLRRGRGRLGPTHSVMCRSRRSTPTARWARGPRRPACPAPRCSADALMMATFM